MILQVCAEVRCSSLGQDTKTQQQLEHAHRKHPADDEFTSV